jgi:hypothetical protein
MCIGALNGCKVNRKNGGLLWCVFEELYMCLFVYVVAQIQMHLHDKLYWDCFRLSPNVILVAYTIVKPSQDDPYVYCMTFVYDFD